MEIFVNLILSMLGVDVIGDKPSSALLVNPIPNDINRSPATKSKYLFTISFFVIILSFAV